jgi:hypothetical protein
LLFAVAATATVDVHLPAPRQHQQADTMAALLSHIVLLALVSLGLCQESSWLTPAGSSPDFSEAFHNTDLVQVAWDAMTPGAMSDLWLNAVDSNYAMRLGANINISAPGTYPWRVGVGNEEIDIDERFQLSFIPTGTGYDKAQVNSYQVSPGFILVKENEPLPSDISSTELPSTTTASVVSSTADSTPTSAQATASPTSAADESSSGLSTGIKVGAAIAALITLALILALLFWALRLRRKVKAAGNHRSSGIVPSSGIMPGPSYATDAKRASLNQVHEVQGDKASPVEIGPSEKRVYYELSG